MTPARRLSGVLLAATLAGCGIAGTDRAAPPAPGAPTGDAGAEPPDAAEPGPSAFADEGPRDGLFHVHLADGALRFGIPPETLEQDLLLMVRSIEGGGGGPSRVVRWERSADHLLLRERVFEERARPGQAIHRAVERLGRGPILARLPIESVGPDSVAVVEVTGLFTGAVPEMGGLGSPEPDRTFVERAWPYPTNVEVEAIQTERRGGGTAGGADTRTARLHWSFLRLPDEPMRPRLHDERVGYLSSSWIDYGSEAHGAERRRVIHRFRLEPIDPGAIGEGGLSDPVRPIVFWIDPATPEWLVPWLRRGVEAWAPAFEEAGFRDAVEARRAPTPEEDPDWSMHDARRSVVHWRASPIANATGVHTVDPRTGEILKAEVSVHHGLMRRLQDGYWVQTGPLDPRNSSLPLPDSLMGRLVEFIVTHEVGHALGLLHNPVASRAYPVDSLRSGSFLRRSGHVASVMDYARFNYVAQPEDSIPPELLVPTVGPYDRFAIGWGHRPIPEADSPEEERPTLDRWAGVQDTIPRLRFRPADEVDELGDAVGDIDPVRASELGLRNLRRVLEMLVPVWGRSGRDPTMLRELYHEAVAQWARHLVNVAGVVGGREWAGHGGPEVRLEPVAGSRQREAVAFLARHAFGPPDVLLEPAVLRRIDAGGAARRIGLARQRVLRALLAPERLERLEEGETLPGPADPAGAADEAYPVADLLEDLRSAVWRRALEPRPRIDVHGRALQRAYLEVVADVVGPAESGSESAASDVRFLLRGELEELAERVEASLGGARDPATRLHLRDVRAEIERILEGARR